MSDLPNLYATKKHDGQSWAVVYMPQGKDDEILCVVEPREDQPAEDAHYRASTIANVLNATVDMCSHDIRVLLEAYEQLHGHPHHSDWRDADHGGGDDHAS